MRRRKRAARAALLTLLTGCMLAPASLAHPGAVDKEGCHVDRSTNERHCHPERLRARQLHTCDLQRPPRARQEGVFYGPVIRVTDGDTFEVKVQGVVMDFRLAEVDAPESDQPYGKQARDELAALIAGKDLVLVPLDTDRYGRTVAFVWSGDRCINRQIVERGAGWFYSKYSTSAYLYDVEETARASRRGLWALPARDRVEPWTWRQKKRQAGS